MAWLAFPQLSPHMKLVGAETSLVITGSWNPAILSPAWIGKNVLNIPDGQEIPLEVEVSMILGVPPRIRIGTFSYVARQARLIVTPTDNVPAHLNSTEAAARRILELLPYTPVSGLGFNFEFLDAQPSEDMLGSFNVIGADIVNSAHENVAAVERKTVFSFSRQLGVVNVTRSLIGDQLKVNFNFHYPLTQASDVAAIPQNRLSEDLIFAKRLVEEIYGLEENQEE